MHARPSIPPAITWLPRDAFWRAVEADAPTSAPDDWITFSMPMAELIARIPVAAVVPPADEEDFPGPVSRWYGRFGDCPLTLTSHHAAPTKDSVVVVFRSDRAAPEEIEQVFAPFRDHDREPPTEPERGVVRR